jgi:N-acetylglucosaminyldiphosphoundecaprenol N-acetyl-beta-D-mannosaminyltransferase
MKVNILGVLIDNLKKSEVLRTVEQFLSDVRQHYIVTANPEMIVAAQKDEKFLEILNKADLSVPDGFGLILAARYLRRPLPERITGVDLMLDICQIAEQKNYSVYLFGGKEGVAQKAADSLQKKFSQLKIAGTENGGIISDQQSTADNQQINSAKPDILFVALGAGKQEKWIAKNLQNLPSIKIAMGVGGAFDFISEKVKRAPRWIRKIGFEWLWRFFMQPWRFKRIFTATIKFSWKVIKNGKKYA